jgi:hypothetical protein
VKKRAKITMTFEVDLDQVPGWGHDTSDWIALIRRDFDRQSHYNTASEVVEIREEPYRWDDDAPQGSRWITPTFATL